WPALSLVPLWMLVAWGMIVRLAVSVVTWERLALPAPRALPPWLAIPFLLALVVATRQAIYRTYADPVWSWLPFALALVLALAVLRPGRRRLALLAAVAVAGPAVEILYIQVGQLHAYRLGWLAGVPLWIVLWWVLAVLVLEQLLAALFCARGTPTCAPPAPRARRDVRAVEPPPRALPCTTGRSHRTHTCRMDLGRRGPESPMLEQFAPYRRYQLFPPLQGAS